MVAAQQSRHRGTRSGQHRAGHRVFSPCRSVTKSSHCRTPSGGREDVEVIAEKDECGPGEDQRIERLAIEQRPHHRHCPGFGALFDCKLLGTGVGSDSTFGSPAYSSGKVVNPLRQKEGCPLSSSSRAHQSQACFRSRIRSTYGPVVARSPSWCFDKRHESAVRPCFSKPKRI